MRRQYHGRQTENAFLVWDVHRLVELSRHLPVIQVDVEAVLAREEGYWISSGNPATPKDVATHAKLIQETDLAFSIILCSEGRVMDGMHRVCKAWVNGRNTISAVRFEETPSPDHVDVDPSELSYDEPW